MLASSTSETTVQHVDQIPSWMLPERTRVLRNHQSKKDHDLSESSVVYWMQRDVRTVDNWALLYASHVAQTSNSTLRVVYCLPPPNPSTESSVIRPFYERLTERYGSFLLGGLQLVHAELADKNIPLHVMLPTDPQQVASTVLDHLEHWKAHTIIGDHSPLKPYRTWWEDNFVALCEARDSKISIVHVDAHNVVPVWHASPKREIGARTLRSKLNRVMDTFLDEFPPLTHQNTNNPSLRLPPWDQELYVHYLQWDTSVPPVDWAQPGTHAGMAQFESFTKIGLPKFSELRNNPNEMTICSHLSPWINHGHISFQRLARILRSSFHKKYANGTAMFLEEGLVRRELSDNFVYYTPHIYDSMDSALVWAQETLRVHASDPREWDFSTSELETSRTHDDLWNAAQLQLVRTGKLHGFLRMYWAKKILEWTSSPTLALQTAQYFNDKYALDGCDPNGFVGVGWSILGIHDQGWKERDVFGKIRFMNYAGCQRKFDVAAFVRQFPPAYETAMEVAKQHGKATANPKAKSETKERKRKAPSVS